MPLHPYQRRTNDLFGRIGSPRASIKQLWDDAIPVVTIDRFYGDEEGSMYGSIAAIPNGTGIPAHRAAVVFGSAVNDWELRALYIDWTLNTTPGGVLRRQLIQCFIVGTAYNPVQFNQGPLLSAGMGTSPWEPATVNGSVFHFTGEQLVTAPNQPFGHLLYSGLSIAGTRDELGDSVYRQFDPPIKVLRNNAFCVQSFGFVGALPTSNSPFFACSPLYNERPRANINPRDGRG